MTDPIYAFLHKFGPASPWELRVAHGTAPDTPAPYAELTAGPDRVPALDVRTAALAELGFRPADPFALWKWVETGGDAPRLFGQLAVRPVQADSVQPVAGR
ncbi:DUF6303 family protein [Streptomyces sp. NPDC059708]|uniref:DUF6303 family protein n=1 Tax=Streptomyces sp. NPDC059708 TaxID=3346916 RepID=UPI0036AB1E17